MIRLLREVGKRGKGKGERSKGMPDGITAASRSREKGKGKGGKVWSFPFPRLVSLSNH